MQQVSQHLSDGQGSPKLRWPGRFKEQRRGYARAVLAALARSLQGRPTPQIRQIVKNSLQPLGVRLSTVELQTIAKGISAGHPVQLPG